jgi:peptide/nickel transport system substrate-binding protein
VQPHAHDNPLEALNITALRRRQGRRSALGVLALVLTLAACNRDRGGARLARRSPDAGLGDASAPVAAPALLLPEVAPATAPPRAGGVLHVHLEAEPPSLNPLTEAAQVVERVVGGGLVYETLVECRGDQYLPGLADSWEESMDRLRVVLHLREQVRFHDNRLLNAIDAQASIEPLLRTTSRQPALRAMLGDVEAVEVVNDHALRLRLRRPTHLVLRALCEVPILPAAAIRGPSGPAYSRPPPGTGPFLVAEWQRGKRIKLLRSRPGAWPHLDEIDFEIDGDGARALARTRRGELDILPRLLELHYPAQVSPGALRDALSLYRLTPERHSFLVVNHHRPLLADARVRRALALLWNRARLAEELHRGLARAEGAPFGEVPPLPYDRAAAEKLLDQAGLLDGNGDGVRDREGAPIHLGLLQPSGARNAAAEARAFAYDLRRAGLLLDVVTVEPAALLARLKKGDFDLAPMQWEGRRDDFPGALFGEGGELAFSGYQSPALDALLDELRLADGPAARAPVLQRIGETLSVEQPAIFLYRHDVPALVSRRVHGLGGQGDHLDLRGVWVDP